MTQTPVIELRDVSVVYNEGTPNEVAALNNVSLRVSQGETVVILGGNGSGKSTLLKAIAGTAPVKTGNGPAARQRCHPLAVLSSFKAHWLRPSRSDAGHVPKPYHARKLRALGW